MNLLRLKELISADLVADEILIFDEVDSTNEVVESLFNKGNISEGAVIIANKQNKGKGRSDRRWISPSGLNLYMSIIFLPDIESAKVPIFTFLSSCALKDTLLDFDLESKIKWPNDLLVSNKKISGVLTEYKYSSTYKRNYLIIGIGVNLNITQDYIINEMTDISDKVTSMRVELNSEIDREIFTAKLIDNIDVYYKQFINYGTLRILNCWLDKWNMIGEKLEVKVDDKIYEGLVEKVDENGFLYLRNKSGDTIKIISGDMVF